MTPIHEDRLRHELLAVSPLDTDPTRLSDALITRGRRARRVRTTAAVAVTTLVLGGAALAVAPFIGRPTPAPAGPITATAPVATVTSTSTPSTSTPSPTPSSPPSNPAPQGKTFNGTVPAEYGQVAFKLPHEGVKSTESDVSDWKPSPWVTTLCGKEFTISGVLGTKAIGQEQPQHWSGEAALVFVDESAAASFVTDYTAYAASCDKAALASNQRVRAVVHQGTPSGTRYASITSISHWTEEKVASGWTYRPGGGAVVLVREGTVVLAAIVGGEYGPDPVTGLPDENARMGVALDGVRANICAAYGGC